MCTALARRTRALLAGLAVLVTTLAGLVVTGAPAHAASHRPARAADPRTVSDTASDCWPCEHVEESAGVRVSWYDGATGWGNWFWGSAPLHVVVSSPIRTGTVSFADTTYAVGPGAQDIPVAGTAPGPVVVRWDITTDDGNESGSTTFKVDPTPPAVHWAGVHPGDQLEQGSSHSFSYACTDDEPITICRVGVDQDGNPQTIDTSTVGTHSVAVYAQNEVGYGRTVVMSYDVVAKADGGPGDDPAPAPKVETTTVITPATQRVEPGKEAHLTATVGGADGTTPANGTVTFREAGAYLGSAVVRAGVATWVWTNPSTAKHTVTAQYVPTADAGYAGSGSDGATVNVQLAPEMVLDGGPWQLDPGQAMTLGVHVVSGTDVPASGTIEVIDYTDEQTSLGTFPLTAAMGGSRSMVLGPFARGFHHLQVKYSGDDDDAPKEGAAPVDVEDWLPSAEDAYTATDDQPLSVDAPGLVANDDPGHTDWRVEVTVPASHGTVSMPLIGPADGGFTYAPYDGFVGDDTFTYHAFAGDRRTKDTVVHVAVGSPWIARFQVQEQRYPSRSWTPVPAGSAGTTTGNPTRFELVLNNPRDVAHHVTATVTDQRTGKVVPLGKVTADLAPHTSQTKEVPYATELEAYAEDGTFIVSPHSYLASADVDGEGTVTATTKIVIRPRPLVLVHGYKSDADASWGEFGRLALSIHPLITTWAVGDGKVPGVMNTGSDRQIFDGGHTNTIEQNATQEDLYVEGVRKATGAWHIDLVAHSMGGLISRYWVQNDMPASIDDVPVAEHLVQLGTPNAGSPCADAVLLASAAAGKPAPLMPATLQLSTGYVQDTFDRQVTDLRGVKLSNLAGILVPVPCPGAMFGDGVVPYDSAVEGVDDVTRMTIDHLDMTESQSVVDEYVRPHVVDRAARSAARTATPAPATAAGTPADASFLDRAVTVPAGGTIQVPLSVPAGSTLGVTTGTGAVGLSLTRKGAVLGSYAAGSAVFGGLTVDRPTAGADVLTVTNPGAASVVVPVQAWVRDTPLGAVVTDAVQHAGTTTVRATALDGGRPVPGAVLTARLVDPSGAVAAVPLYDDGTHGDATAGDGSWTGTAARPSAATAVVSLRSPRGNRDAVAGVRDADAPVVTTPPADARAVSGTTARFTVSATGVGRTTWQWTVPGQPWRTVAGASGTTLAVAATTALSGRQYRAVLVGAHGTVASRPATLTVVRATPRVVLTAPAKVATGAPVHVSVVVTTDGAPAAGGLRILDGGAVVGTVQVVAGTTTYAVDLALPTGPHRLVGRIDGSAEVAAGSSAPVTVSVG